MKRLRTIFGKMLRWVWQRRVVFIVAALILGAVYFIILNGGTGFGEYTDPTGEYYRAKSLWDLLELLVIPIALTILAYFFNKSERENDRRIAREERDNDRAIALDRLQESNLQNYFDKMAELLQRGGLRQVQKEGEVSESRVIARARTLTVLRTLDKNRKAQLLQFLYESNLIAREKTIIYLSGADLSGANLCGAHLSEANLSEANLSGANLQFSYLNGANLGKANLREANLLWAKMSEANLELANLEKADLTLANLRKTNLYNSFLNGANLSMANLSEANLTLANFSDANLDGANVSNATLDHAIVTQEQLLKADSTGGMVQSDGTLIFDMDK